jgi:hypothetical protein
MSRPTDERLATIAGLVFMAYAIVAIVLRWLFR